ncbi:hypothetical protein [Ammoniphilus resinae]|uniref:Uncharacterized protein n=1 Tax=Ammoniphilus resinae TaxID=861532 RepID=A0ABS4GLV4_9BACL|nr:hypothetical protein [Ammoniphilus resinae]MBP1931231.1 hypothetical protein [Ammoniphilus resinae]
MLRTCIILLTLVFILQLFGQVAEASEIEVFDVSRGKVVKHIVNTPQVQQEIKNMVYTITGMVSDLKIEPNDGYLVKIPMEPPVMIKNQWMDLYAEELILFLSPTSEPKLLIFSDENRPYFVHFNYDISFLLLDTI